MVMAVELHKLRRVGHDKLDGFLIDRLAHLTEVEGLNTKLLSRHTLRQRISQWLPVPRRCGVTAHRQYADRPGICLRQRRQSEANHQ